MATTRQVESTPVRNGVSQAIRGDPQRFGHSSLQVFTREVKLDYKKLLTTTLTDFRRFSLLLSVRESLLRVGRSKDNSTPYIVFLCGRLQSAHSLECKWCTILSTRSATSSLQHTNLQPGHLKMRLQNYAERISQCVLHWTASR